MKSKLFYIFYTIALSFVLYIIFTNNQATKSINSSESISNRTEQPSPVQSEKENLSEFLRNIQMAGQIMRELDYLLKEMEKGDDLESAIDAMSIAYEEALIVVEKISNFNFSDPKLLAIQKEITIVVTEYTEGLGLLLEGFEHGDGEQMQSGYQETIKSKEKFFELETSLKDL
ncbi:hypothetical protein IM538_12875 [Cytobacillus suaedae]|nr:hypothetical protein IM538_12875 [Cytobacillus suaedae]